MNTYVISNNYTTLTMIYQGFKTEYHKNVLNKIKRHFFNEVVMMAKSGATNEEIWHYQMSEISRVYRLRKIRKAIKHTNAILIESFKRISLKFNRISSREYRSASRRKTTTASANSGDSGDSDQPEPPSPPGLAYLLTPSYLISRTPKKNRYSSSWQSAPNSCSMVGGGKI